MVFGSFVDNRFSKIEINEKQNKKALIHIADEDEVQEREVPQ